MCNSRETPHKSVVAVFGQWARNWIADCVDYIQFSTDDDPPFPNSNKNHPSVLLLIYGMLINHYLCHIFSPLGAHTGDSNRSSVSALIQFHLLMIIILIQTKCAKWVFLAQSFAYPPLLQPRVGNCNKVKNDQHTEQPLWNDNDDDACFHQRRRVRSFVWLHYSPLNLHHGRRWMLFLGNKNGGSYEIVDKLFSKLKRNTLVPLA